MKGFYHIWEWRPSSISDHNHFSYFSFPQCLDATYEIWLHLAQWFQRRSRLKVWTDDGGFPYYKLPEAFGSGELKSYVIFPNLTDSITFPDYSSIFTEANATNAALYHKRDQPEKKSSFIHNLVLL